MDPEKDVGETKQATPKRRFSGLHIGKKTAVVLVVIVLAAAGVGYVVWRTYSANSKTTNGQTGPKQEDLYQTIKFSQGADNSAAANKKLQQAFNVIEQKAANNQATYQDYSTLARYYEMTGDKNKAIGYYQQAIQVADPKMPGYTSFVSSTQNVIKQLQETNKK